MQMCLHLILGPYPRDNPVQQFLLFQFSSDCEYNFKQYMYAFIYLSTLDPIHMMEDCTVRRCQNSWHSQEICFKNFNSPESYMLPYDLISPLKFFLTLTVILNWKGKECAMAPVHQKNVSESLGRSFSKYRCLPSYLQGKLAYLVESQCV